MVLWRNYMCGIGASAIVSADDGAGLTKTTEAPAIIRAELPWCSVAVFRYGCPDIQNESRKLIMQSFTNPTVLLVEDDSPFAEELSEFLVGHGLKAVVCDSLADLAPRVQELQPDALVLDQFVGGRDVLPLLAGLRSIFAGGIMVLTGNQDRTDRIVALEVGADDFISKSAGPREFLARLRAVLRRAQLHAGGEQPTVQAKPGGRWRIDTRRLEVHSPDGTLLPLTRTEFHALVVLMQKAGELVTRDHVSLTVLGRRFSPLDRSVDNMVSRVRKALEPHLGGQPSISSVRGKGYVFDAFVLADVALTDSAGLFAQDGNSPYGRGGGTVS
jgi:DNA-binding response OmpR family regulator